MKLKPDVKKRWVKALRSGKYNQVRTYLCTDSGFCCLGVLYDVEADDMWVPEYDTSSEDAEWGRFGWCYSAKRAARDCSLRGAHELSDEFCARVGLTREIHDGLAAMNDDEGKTFAQIADFIEKKL
jgi:hypothetical protein